MSATLSPLFTWRSAICETGLPAGTRHVALVLSLHMNERGGSCFPSIATLTKETGKGQTSVVDALRQLEAEGWLGVKHPEVTGRGKKNEYSALFPEGSYIRPFSDGKGPVNGRKGPEGGKEDVKEDVLKDSEFKCHHCDGLAFAGPRGLERHLRNVHDEVTA